MWTTWKMKDFIYLNISAKQRLFVRDETSSSKIMNRTGILKGSIGNWKLRNSWIISCKQPKFLSHSRTKNPKCVIFDMTFYAILPLIGYSHIYHLFILFHEIFKYLIQYLLQIWLGTFKTTIKSILVLFCLSWNEWHCIYFHISIAKKELFQTWRTKKAILTSVQFYLKNLL